MTGESRSLAKADTFIRAARLADLEAAGRLAVQVSGHTVALFCHRGKIYATDNRCPHMGFPLDRGTVNDGILTCHWHHARFDLASGGTFDQWADDVRTFPVDVRDGEVWVDLSPAADALTYQRNRLGDGLERDIPLIIAKSVISLLDAGADPAEPFRIGLDFGARYRQAGWGQGLTMHTCFLNLLPHLDAEDRPRALYHGLSAVARECHGVPPRFGIRALPNLTTGLATLKRWFRQFVEVRDAEGAERCVASAVRTGAGCQEMVDMLFTAATDHRYIQSGHIGDFTNKTFEALDRAGWEYAEPALASLAFAYANADRMEESNAWRKPVDLVDLLESAFKALPAALETGLKRRQVPARGRADRERLVPVFLGDDPSGIADALVAALREGSTEEELAGIVAYAAALRIAQFHTGNEFDDWVRALHTFSFANAIHQAIRRVPTAELLRGVFDAAMSVYLDRFLNIPAARLPEPNGVVVKPESVLQEFLGLLNTQQQVNKAGEYVANYLSGGGQPERLMAVLGHALLREDRDFHTIQAVEAAFRQHAFLRGTPAGIHVLVAAARYLAAHAPTVRAQGQTYRIAWRLHRGECLFEEATAV